MVAPNNPAEPVNEYYRAALKQDYENVRASNPDAGLKPYDDLTDEQRANHQAIYEKTSSFFDKLGEAIRTGGPLPDPFGD